MGIKYIENNQVKEVKVKVGDNIPVGAEMDYDGNTIPVGWEEVDNPNKYYKSTTEQVVGEWINGKPIYRRVLQGTTTSSVRSVTFPKSDISSNLDEILFVSGHTVQPNNNFTNIPYYIDSTDYTQWYYTQAGVNLTIVNGTSHGFGTHYVVVEYTKTTDTANS